MESHVQLFHAFRSKTADKRLQLNESKYKAFKHKSGMAFSGRYVSE